MALKILAVRRVLQDFKDPADAMFTDTMNVFTSANSWLSWETVVDDKTALANLEGHKTLVFQFCRETYQGHKDNTFASAVRTIKKEGDSTNRLSYGPLLAELRELSTIWAKATTAAATAMPPAEESAVSGASADPGAAPLF